MTTQYMTEIEKEYLKSEKLNTQIVKASFYAGIVMLVTAFSFVFTLLFKLWS